MKTIKRTMYYPTFNETKNDFDYKEVTHERPMTKEEVRKNAKYHTFCWLGVGTIAFFVFSLIMELSFHTNLWDLLLIPYSIIMCVGLCHIFNRTFTLEDAVSGFSSNGFDKEIAEWERITEEQNAIAKEWRKAHPFEEHIRKAQLSGSSVDIAKAAVYYAENIIKGGE